MPVSGGPGALAGQAIKSSTVSEFLSNAYTALELAIKLAPFIPVPFVSSMLASAQVIVDSANNMHDCKLQSAELAEYAAQLTYEVHRVIRGRERLIDDDLKTALGRLQTRLNETKDIMEEQVNLNLWQRIAKRRTLTDKLSRCKTNLQYSMTTFATTSAISEQIMLQGIGEQMDKLLETVAKGRQYDDEKNRYRIYRVGEVNRLSRRTQIGVRRVASIDYYDAEVEGQLQLRIMKQYHDLKTFREALEILYILSECPSVNVAQLEGFSPLNSVPHFLVLKGDLRPFHSYIVTLAEAPRYLASLRAMDSIVDTIIFLRRRRLTWTNEVNKLMLNTHGEVILGVNDDIRLYEQPSDSGRIPILTDWGTRNDGTSSYRKTKSLSLHKLQSEQPSIRALQDVLTNPDPCHWSIEKVANLWYQYIAEWGTVVSSSMTTVRVAECQPLIGFGYFQQDVHGKQQLHRISPADFGGQYLRNRSWYKKSDGQTVASNYTLFHGLSCLTDVQEVRAAIRRDMPYTTAWGYMLRFGLTNARRHGIDLKDMVFVYQVAQRLSAFLDSEDPASVQFHVQPPNDDGFMQKPWGYFSTEHDMSQNDNAVPVECLGVDNDSGKLLFSNNSPGVSAMIKHYYKISYIQLQPREAMLVEWIHNRFS